MNTQTDQLNYKFGLDTESTNEFNSPNATTPIVPLPPLSPPQPPSFSDLASSIESAVAPAVEAKVADAGAFREFASARVPKLTIPATFTPKPVTVSGSAIANAPGSPLNSMPFPVSTANRTERLNTIPV